jgi:hypothetical protein
MREMEGNWTQSEQLVMVTANANSLWKGQANTPPSCTTLVESCSCYTEGAKQTTIHVPSSCDTDGFSDETTDSVRGHGIASG